MRVLGIDPGTATTGYGLVWRPSDDDSLVLIEYGVLRTSSDSPMAERLLNLHDGVDEIVQSLEPDVVAVEELYFARNVTSALTVGQARGVILLAAARACLPVYEYQPRQIKLALTGYGSADKRQVQEMVRLMLNLAAPPRPDDAADAIATALTHLQTARYDERAT